jgi:N-acetylglucosaminyldiphosphoundecaprenol N-acetyl-beta-D-mannosaminyltransferase
MKPGGTPQRESSRGYVDLLGVRIDKVTTDDVLTKVEEFVAERGKRTIMYANVHVVNEASKDKELMEVLNQADVVYPDGHGVVLGARMLGDELPPRMTGADWIYDLCALAERKDYSLYIIAGEPGTLEQAGKELGKRFPRLRILGISDGFFHTRGEAPKVISDVNAKKPHIVFIGMGTPIQEKFTSAYRQEMEAPVCWVVGALFDYVAGRMRRGPRWMLDHGMEWLCRLVFEPRRLWRRYLIGNSVFLLRIGLQRLRGGR